MTLQRRMLLFLLISAPLVWAGALLFDLNRARAEINELFDTELIRLARQVQSTLPLAELDAIERPPLSDAGQDSMGDAELGDLAIAVWNQEGRLVLVDREGVRLPREPQASGFREVALDGAPWRIYYLQSATGQWLVAVGQVLDERNELVWDLVAGQLLPWALTLPVLLLVMAGAVRQALRPLNRLTGELQRRGPDDLGPIQSRDLPEDLQPLVRAMDTLMARTRDTLERERRFTADAAHELRTPLAALQAQWDASQLGDTPQGQKVGQGLARLSRLVTQLLSMSRLDRLSLQEARDPIDWQDAVGRVFGELIPLADRQQVELACEWPVDGARPMALCGDPTLIESMLRNLLDNAIRHSPPGASVSLRFEPDALEVRDEGCGVPPEHLPHLGHRFFRAPGETSAGSGLGLSIVQRIADLHGLRAEWRNRADRSGFLVRLSRDPAMAGSDPPQCAS